VVVVVVVVVIVVVAVVVGYYYIMQIFCRVFVHRKQRQERSEVAMVPMPATAPSNSYNNVAFDDASAGRNRPPISTPSSSPYNGDMTYEPPTEYHTASDDQRSGVGIDHAYEELGHNRPKLPTRPRVAK